MGFRRKKSAKRMILELLILLLMGSYALLYVLSQKQFEVVYGASFNQEYATLLGLDWKDAYRAMLLELKFKFIRIPAAWNAVEKEQNRFDTTDISWQMDEANKHGAKVILVIGQKTPRWPECRVPDWAGSLPLEDFKAELFDYIRHVVKQYQNHPALDIWQVENEPFILFRFGECEQFRKELVDETIKLVKELDPGHKVMVTDSGELGTWLRASRAGDLFGTTLYRIVRTPGGKIIKHDWIPAAFYRVKAKVLKLNPPEVFISELQAEPWFTSSTPLAASIEEQEKTMNPERFKKHLEYARHTGFSRAYLWGVEWIYWMKTTKGDARYWEILKEYVPSS